MKKWNSCVGVHNVIGQYLYKGEFRNGNKDGYGIYIVTTPAHKGNKYIGEFKNDMKDGLGTYTYANGDNYVGSFKFNKRNGKGIFTTKNGEKYDGEYKDDKREGYGIYTKPSGEKFVGYWGNDSFISKSNTDSDEISSNKKNRNTQSAKNEEIKISPSLETKVAAVKKEKKEYAPLNLNINIVGPDQNGVVVLNIDTGTDTSSLKINDNEEGGSEEGKYKITRVARVGQTTEFKILAIDFLGRKSEKLVSVFRENILDNTSFELKPEKLIAKNTEDAVAIIIGIQNYKSIGNSEFSSNDAKLFFDYANKALGIRSDRIKLLIDDQATGIEIIKALKLWLPNQVNRHLTKVYVFFSGHGISLNNDLGLIFLPFDADRDFLERTSLKQSEISKYISDTNPNNTIFFIDSCFSGHTKTGNLIISNSRPLNLKTNKYENNINTNILSAANFDEISYSSKSLKHGLFSYYLMRGLEGEADLNDDKLLSLGELNEYLQKMVPKFASTMNKIQNPQLFGDPNLIIVKNK